MCESDELKGSTISSVLAVEQDGKIVYDVRPGSAIASDSAKWAQGVQFYFGDEAQMPPSTLEAIHGVGNNPAYRGVLLAVFKDFNLTSVGDRIPTFRFLVAAKESATLKVPASNWSLTPQPGNSVRIQSSVPQKLVIWVPPGQSVLDVAYSRWATDTDPLVPPSGAWLCGGIHV